MQSSHQAGRRNSHETVGSSAGGSLPVPPMSPRDSKEAHCTLHPRRGNDYSLPLINGTVRTTNGEFQLWAGISRELSRLCTVCSRLACHWVTAALTAMDANRDQFRANLKLPKKDFATIEYLLRRGRRQLELYSAPGIRNISR